MSFFLTFRGDFHSFDIGGDSRGRRPYSIMGRVVRFTFGSCGMVCILRYDWRGDIWRLFSVLLLHSTYDAVPLMGLQFFWECRPSTS